LIVWIILLEVIGTEGACGGLPISDKGFALEFYDSIEVATKAVWWGDLELEMKLNHRPDLWVNLGLRGVISILVEIPDDRADKKLPVFEGGLVVCREVFGGSPRPARDPSGAKRLTDCLDKGLLVAKCQNGKFVVVKCIMIDDAPGEMDGLVTRASPFYHVILIFAGAFL